MAQRPKPPLKSPTGQALGFDIAVLVRDGTTSLVPRVLIDGLPLVDASVYALDVGLLLQSQVRSGSFFILTCWCGVPECVGIDTGVTVRADAAAVTWESSAPTRLGARTGLNAALTTQPSPICAPTSSSRPKRSRRTPSLSQRTACATWRLHGAPRPWPRKTLPAW